MRKKLENLFDFKLRVKKIFQGSRDGFRSSIFHKNCDDQGPTITIILTKDQKIFGGYTDKCWKSTDKIIKGDGNSFVFSYKNNNNFEKLNSLSDKQEVSHYSDRLCYFYAAFTIEDNCNNNKYNKDIYKRNRCLLN